MLKYIKISKSQQAAYNRYLDAKKKQSARLNSLTAIFLFVNLTILHYWLIPSSFQEVQALGFLAITNFLLLFLSTYQSFFSRYYAVIISIGYLIPSFMIESIIFLSKPSELAYYVSFSTLLIIIMTMFSWAHLSSRVLILTISLIVAGLISAILFHQGDEGLHSVYLILISNLFFLGAAIIAGVVSRLMRDSNLKQNFILQQSLENALDEKIKEVKKFEFYSNHDQLTGLTNRRFAEKNFSKKISKVEEKENITFVLMFLDLNNFKIINDTYGHEAGDKVLRVTSERLKLLIREEDNLVRLGGDEFLICLEINRIDDLTLYKVRKKIKDCISQPIRYKQNTLIVTTSIGVSRYPEDGESLEALIKSADTHMYKEKKDIDIVR